MAVKRKARGEADTTQSTATHQAHASESAWTIDNWTAPTHPSGHQAIEVEASDLPDCPEPLVIWESLVFNHKPRVSVRNTSLGVNFKRFRRRCNATVRIVPVVLDDKLLQLTQEQQETSRARQEEQRQQVLAESEWNSLDGTTSSKARSSRRSVINAPLATRVHDADDLLTSIVAPSLSQRPRTNAAQRNRTQTQLRAAAHTQSNAPSRTSDSQYTRTGHAGTTQAPQAPPATSSGRQKRTRSTAAATFIVD